MVAKFTQGRRERKPGSTSSSSSSSSSSWFKVPGGAASLEDGSEKDVVVQRPRERFRPAPRELARPRAKPYRGNDAMEGVSFVNSDEDLEHLIEESRRKGTKLFVEFGTAWCDHCKGMVSSMVALGKEHPRHTFAVADVFRTPVLSKSVVYTPTFWVYDRGVKVDQLVGSNKTNLRDRAWLHLA